MNYLTISFIRLGSYRSSSNPSVSEKLEIQASKFLPSLFRFMRMVMIFEDEKGTENMTM